MLPEHVQMLKEFQVDYHKQKKPTLDEYQLQDIDQTIYMSVQNNRPVHIKIWQEGYFIDIVGTIHKVDHIQKVLWILDESDESHKVHQQNIVGIACVD